MSERKVSFTSDWLHAQKCPACGEPPRMVRPEFHSSRIAGESVEYGMVTLMCEQEHHWSKVPE